MYSCSGIGSIERTLRLQLEVRFNRNHLKFPSNAIFTKVTVPSQNKIKFWGVILKIVVKVIHLRNFTINTEVCTYRE